jgi:hypothetical protein
MEGSRSIGDQPGATRGKQVASLMGCDAKQEGRREKIEV